MASEQKAVKREVKPARRPPPPSPYLPLNSPGLPGWAARRAGIAGAEQGGGTSASSVAGEVGSGPSAPSHPQRSGSGPDPSHDEGTSRKASIFAGIKEPKKDAPRDSSVLLYCERGAMWLHEFGSRIFGAMALYLVNQQDRVTVVGSGERFVDILRPEQVEADPVSLKAGGRIFDSKYGKEIAPFLGLKDYQFRIRSDAYEKGAAWDNGSKGSIKMTRINGGYCYVNAAGSWNDAKQRTMNEARFESALDFLYQWDQEQEMAQLAKANLTSRSEAPYVPMPEKLTIQILAGIGCPEPASYNIERGEPLPLELEESLEKLSKLDPLPSNPHDRIQCRYSKEIFVHETCEEFVPPFTAVTEQKAEAEKEEERARGSQSREQQEASDPTATSGTVLQIGQRRLSMMPPTTMIEDVPASPQPYFGPRKPTLSEFQHVERCAKAAEAQLQVSQAKCDWLEGQLDDYQELKLENSTLQGFSRTQEVRTQELEQKCSQFENNSLFVSEIDVTLQQENKDLRVEKEELETEKGGLEIRCMKLGRENTKLDHEVSDRESALDAKIAECDRLRADLEAMTEERDLLRNRVTEIRTEIEAVAPEFPDKSPARNTAKQTSDRTDTNKSPARNAANLNMSTESADPIPAKNTAKEKAVSPTPDVSTESADTKKLLYCNVCFTSVNSLDEKLKAAHGRKCNTTVEDFILLTIEEAKARRAAKKAAASAPKKEKRKRDEAANDEPAAGPSETHDGDDQTDRPQKRRRHDEGETAAATRPKRSKKPAAKTQTATTTTTTTEAGPSASSAGGKALSTRKRKETPAPSAQVIEPDGDSPPPKVGANLKRISGWDGDEPEGRPTKRSRK